MTLQEARQKVAENNGHETWEAFVLNSGKTSSEYGNEAIELFRAHWEAVGVKKGMEQALEVAKDLDLQEPWTDYFGEPIMRNGNSNGGYISFTELQAAIEKLSN